LRRRSGAPFKFDYGVEYKLENLLFLELRRKGIGFISALSETRRSILLPKKVTG
jgi:hypothetical protein